MSCLEGMWDEHDADRISISESVSASGEGRADGPGVLCCCGEIHT